MFAFLTFQTYRHVDSVMFENPHIVERFISYWRSTGNQRMGLLYGNYEQHTDVPLGIRYVIPQTCSSSCPCLSCLKVTHVIITTHFRARVAAIYEPPQENSRDTIKFDIHNPKVGIVNEIAKTLGLRCVGWIFTDLLPEDTSKGTVKHVRGGHSFFMSAQECITAAYLQTLHPNPSKYSPSRYFGSKFATVIITGMQKLFTITITNQSWVTH
jgi:nuclear protein localization family protein 4